MTAILETEPKESPKDELKTKPVEEAKEESKAKLKGETKEEPTKEQKPEPDAESLDPMDKAEEKIIEDLPAETQEKQEK
jgi:hypothetical protein